MAEWVIGRLTDGHDRAAFACGKPPLDKFIRELAGQYERKRVGRTYVATEPGRGAVAGYYTAAGAVGFERLPAGVAKKLPRHPVPVVLLGRLAADRSYQGKGLGSVLLLHTLRTAATAADVVGAFAVLTEAIDGDAQAFYRKHGFTPFADQPLHLLMPMSAVAATLDAIGG